jgi:hypothetical protein
MCEFTRFVFIHAFPHCKRFKFARRKEFSQCENRRLLMVKG